MKLQVKTEFVPLSLFDRLISVFQGSKGIPIEGRNGRIVAELIPLDEEAHTELETMIEFLSGGLFTTQVYDEFTKMNLVTGNKTIVWNIIIPTAGMSELRVYIKDLKDEDIILDEKNADCKYKLRFPHKEVPLKTRFYMKPVKIYSLSEIMLYLFAGLSTLGAVFEILSFFLKP